jgi:hypothetical protein
VAGLVEAGRSFLLAPRARLHLEQFWQDQ